MKKIKNQKRVFAITLVVLMLATLLSIGASARIPQEVGVCDCLAGKQMDTDLESFEADVLYSFFLTCDECETVYEISLLLHDGIAKDSDNQVFLFTFEFDDSLTDGYLELHSWEEESINRTGFRVQSVKVVSSDDGGSSMVGSMVGTMTQGVGGILVGVGNSIVGFFDSTVLDDNGNLTTFATWVLAFLGLAFGLGVVKFITYLVKK